MRRIGFGCFLFLTSLTGAVVSATPPRGLVVHEWGTFLSMAGSDGVTLDGMYHEEHALPAFVHSRSRDQLHLPSALVKGETPVIYFYTDQRQPVRVHVGFPDGIWTQWYPQAAFAGPALTGSGSPPSRSGHIEWNAELIPAASDPAGAALPRTAPGALWDYARDVDAAFVKTRNRITGQEERERFLFYRGLGQTALPLQFTVENGGTLRWLTREAAGSAAPRTTEGAAPTRVFVLNVADGRGAFHVISVPPQTDPQTGQVEHVIPSLSNASGLDDFSRAVGSELERALEESGLYAKESQAMVNTWSSSYFRSDGIRALVVMPREWTDRTIPLQIDPTPARIERVMVGRLELLSEEREQRAEKAVRELGSPEAEVREAAFKYLLKQGRYVEPVLRRVESAATDQRLREQCRKLLQADFVTELRAAELPETESHPAPRAGANPSGEYSYAIHAQLASILRDLGEDDGARQEARMALDELRTVPQPPLTDPRARHTLRAYARAEEGAGDAPAAAAAYGKFIRFASQLPHCGSCHALEGPRDMAWFRDWWAGRKFAACIRRAEKVPATIAEEKAALAADPNDTAARMMLAYLYEAADQPQRAAEMWARLDSITGSRQEPAKH